MSTNTKRFLKPLFGFAMLAIGIWHSTAHAAVTIQPRPPIVGSVVEDVTGAGHAGSGVFDWNGSVLIPPADGSGEPFVHHAPGETLFLHGNFWLGNVGWAKFDLCAEGVINTPTGCTLSGGTNGDAYRPKLVGVGAADADGYYATYALHGYAWSENAGWLALKHDEPATHNVVYDRLEGKLHGYAWSTNLGWVSFENLGLDITPPSPTNFTQVFAADHAKNFQVFDAGSGAAAGYPYDVTVEDWSSSAEFPYSSTSFVHDFRLAKSYHVRIADAFGNAADGTVRVVADAPATALQPGTDIGTLSSDSAVQATTYSDDFSTSKIADGTDRHSFTLKLRDRYGNAVVTEPGIKKVETFLSYANDLDTNQLDLLSPLGMGNLDIGNAVSFPDNAFVGLSFLSGSTGTASDAFDGTYSGAIASHAPSKSGYSYTTDGNDVKMTKLSYRITTQGAYASVGEVNETSVTGVGIDALKFAPALKIDDTSVKMNGSSTWNVTQGYDARFTAGFSKPTAESVTQVRAANVLDLNDTNLFMSYQEPGSVVGGSEVCHGFQESIAWPNSQYSTGGTQNFCDRRTQTATLNSSNLLLSFGGAVGDGDSFAFSWTPKIIISSPPSNSIRFASELEYEVAGVAVKHPSYARNTSSSSGEGVSNQGVKIIGASNANKTTFDIVQNTSSNVTSSLNKTEIRNLVHKNVADFLRNRTDFSGTELLVVNGSTGVTSWPAGKRTLIVKDGDVTIENDLFNPSGKPIAIIAIAENDRSKGNVRIKPSVKNLEVSLYADGTILSWNGVANVADDPSTGPDQLYLHGTLISNNTIGGSSVTPARCPVLMTDSCTAAEAKKWDLNFFRFYQKDPDGAGPLTGVGTAATGVPPSGTDYPFIIRFDPKIISDPPPGFEKKE